MDPLAENSEEVEMLHFGLATEQTNPQTTQTQASTDAEIDFDDDDASYENGELFESTSTGYSREVLEDLNSLDLKQEIERCPVSSITMKKDEEGGEPGPTVPSQAGPRRRGRRPQGHTPLTSAERQRR